jgi:hypothetical protein
MTQDEQIEIPLSKKKMAMTLMGAIAFVGIGFWFVIKPPKIDNLFFGNPTILFIVGLSSIVFFGLIAFTIFRKLSDNKPGFIINRDGIIDNSSGISAGPVLWTDIEIIRVTQVMNQKFILIILKNPQDYIDRVKNPLKRKGMEVNYKNYGSPINISANALQTNFDELYKLLQEKMEHYKS